MEAVVARRYRLVRLLGSGAWGDVHLADDLLRPGRQVALKTRRFDPRTAPRGPGGLAAEFRTLTRLRHPHLARVFDLGLSRDPASGAPLVYFTREYVEGTDLVAALRGADGAAVVRAAVLLCHALAAVHERGVIHGDLAPGNVIGRPGEPDSLRVIDFGLARLVGDGESSASGLRGSLYYVAPEVLGGALPSVASDLYALGALLYHAIAGEPPFRGTVAQVLEQHLDAAPRPLAALRPDLTPACAAVVGRLLAKDPARRYASARDALRDLEGGVPAAPLPAVEPPFVGRDPLLDEVEALARAGSPVGLVALVGEDGAGKSRALEALRWRIQLGGVCRAVDVAGETALAEPLAAMRELIGHLLLLAPDDTPGAEDAAAFARGAAPCDTDGARECLAAFAARAVAAIPAVVLVDDADVLPIPAWTLLRHLARALDENAEAPPLIVTSRPGRRSDELLGELERARRYDLGELDEAAVGRIVAAVAGSPRPDVAARVLEHAGGQPGWVEEATRAVLERERRGGDPSLPVPSGLRAAVVERLAARTEAERALLEAAAVVGGAVCWSDVPGEPALPDESSFLDTGRRLVAAGFLTESGPGQFAFERAAVRAAVYESCLAERRMQLHAAAWHRLAPAGGAPPEGRARDDAARHAVRAGPTGADADRAVALALASATELTRGGQADEAAGLLQEALGLATGPRRAAVRVALAEALATLGEYDAALERLTEAARGVEGPARAEVLAIRGGVLERRGAYDEATDALRQAIEAGPPPEAVARVRETLARLHLARGAYDEAAEEALRAAEAAWNDPALKSRALATAGVAAGYRGRRGEAVELLARARGAAKAAGDAAAEAAAVGHLAIVQGREGDLRAAQRLFAEAAELAERAGDLGRLPSHLVNLGTAHHRLGEVDASIALYRRAAQLARRIGKPSAMVAALVNLADRYAYVGATAEGREAAARALELAGRQQMPAFAARAHLALAECAAGEAPGDGVADAERACAMFEELGLARDAAEARVVAAELLLWAGQPRRAADAAAEAAARLRGGPDRDVQARAELVQAESLALLEERTEQVVEVLERLSRTDGPEVDADLRWRALAGLAFLRARQGDESEARRLAAEANRVLGGIEAQVPAEHRDAFVERHPARAALRRYLRREASSGAMLERVFRLMAVHRAVVAERDPRRILALALDTAIDLCGAERGFLLMRGPKGAMHVEVARNVDHEAIRSARLKVSRSIAEEVGRTGTPILTLNAQEDERFERFESVRDLKLRSVMCVPIRGRDAILGTMYLDNRFQPGRFGEPDLRLLLAFADVVAVALENARLAEENARHAAELERAKAELEAATREQARRLETALRELEATREALGLRYDYARIIGRSPGMLRVLQTLDRVIETQVPVLIRGESGTGKELIARALHFNGPRRDRPFITVNCGAIPEALMESELFGHVRGAFTGAVRDREGLFAAAHGGTLFLDEVGDMSPAMQVKLLRALQEGEIRPVGASADRKVDVRVVAASHHDLARLVAEGRFREDLFYRLNVVSITVPPLRERKEDIPLLAEHLLERFAAELGGVHKKLRPDALRRLLDHPWPGNVREIENVLKNAAVLSRSDEIGPEDIPLPAADDTQSTTPSSLRLDEVEMRTIHKALQVAGGNKKLAAELLGISRLTLYRKLKEA